ncbi:MAG: replication-associated recombination protein A, partial [Acidimicrobiales bacterium]
APKSNRVATAMWGAMADVADRPKGAVPAHLRDAHYKGSASIGHGRGYAYPHDDERGWVDQRHLPDELAGTIYYRPSGHGFEAEVAARMVERS